MTTMIKNKIKTQLKEMTDIKSPEK